MRVSSDGFTNVQIAGSSAFTFFSVTFRCLATPFLQRQTVRQEDVQKNEKIIALQNVQLIVWTLLNQALPFERYESLLLRFHPLALC